MTAPAALTVASSPRERETMAMLSSPLGAAMLQAQQPPQQQPQVENCSLGPIFIPSLYIKIKFSKNECYKVFPTSGEGLRVLASCPPLAAGASHTTFAPDIMGKTLVQLLEA